MDLKQPISRCVEISFGYCWARLEILGLCCLDNWLNKPLCAQKVALYLQSQTLFFSTVPVSVFHIPFAKTSDSCSKTCPKKKNCVKPSSDLQFRHIPPTASASLTHRNSCRFTGSLRHAKTAGLCEVTHACFPVPVSSSLCYQVSQGSRNIQYHTLLFFFFALN